MEQEKVWKVDLCRFPSVDLSLSTMLQGDREEGILRTHHWLPVQRDTLSTRRDSNGGC